MEFTAYQMVLGFILIISGSVNTIAAKWMNTIKALSGDGIVRHFEHPFIQSDILFVGEMLCMVAFTIIYYMLKKRRDGSVEEHPLTKGSRTYNPLILWPAAVLDMVAVSLMFFGLLKTNASSFQMLRGSVIIFVALLSYCILRKKPKVLEFIGIAFIIIAMIIIGLADMLNSEYSTNGNNELVGDILIVFGQFAAATQFVYEEVFVVKLDIPPLQTVGWEGVFGFIIMTILMVPFSFISLPPALHGTNPTNTLEDPVDAFIQIGNSPLILAPIFLLLISIAFYNFSGISITKELSATTRVVLDSVRILVVWIFSISMSWQKFHYLQVVGFIFLIIGMVFYNDIYVTKTISLIRNKLYRDGIEETKEEEKVS